MAKKATTKAAATAAPKENKEPKTTEVIVEESVQENTEITPEQVNDIVASIENVDTTVDIEKDSKLEETIAKETEEIKGIVSDIQDIQKSEERLAEALSVAPEPDEKAIQKVEEALDKEIKKAENIKKNVSKIMNSALKKQDTEIKKDTRFTSWWNGQSVDM